MVAGAARRQGLQRLHRNQYRARCQESTILALYNTVHHFGGIVVAPGYTDPIKFADGNPYGTSHIAGHGDLPITDTTRQAAAYQGARVVNIAAALKVGLHACLMTRRAPIGKRRKVSTCPGSQLVGR